MLLVVEDNLHFSATISKILSAGSFVFDIVANGREAVSRVANRGDAYAVALVDIRLPDVPGDAVVRMIRSVGDPTKAEVPIVMMTGGPQVPAELIAECHICAVLYKPFLVADLLKVIGQCARWTPRFDATARLPENLVIGDGDAK